MPSRRLKFGMDRWLYAIKSFECHYLSVRETQLISVSKSDSRTVKISKGRISNLVYGIFHDQCFASSLIAKMVALSSTSRTIVCVVIVHVITAPRCIGLRGSLWCRWDYYTLCDLTATWANVQLHYHERNTFVVLFMQAQQGLPRLQRLLIAWNVIKLSSSMKFNIQKYFEKYIITNRVG